ncbi:hypothetical protein VPK21_004760 [Sinorhizobium kummerowiae]|uniref:Transmembrane protein n=1 Tax=Sinorhizobium kummerowiae TaxID=158892 RepID=A0ABY8T9N1_9HYPH|nr:hypothetical protein [Sinorhizobium kummerowiae]WHS94608.1 hypothetical protein PZL22_002343 [Sinorhizobium kummerowiae]WRW46552.1 hypothetical protein VPK21_004760 [Sinorhizobium kummerowiae]
MSQADAQTIGPGPLFQGAVDLLKFGPLGLAGLMLVLVIVALAVRDMSPGRERLLKLYMYVGAFCFVVSAVLSAITPTSVHMVHFRVEPLAQGAVAAFPPPQITINSDSLTPPLKYPVKSEVTAIIDVSDAIEFVRNFRQQIREQDGRMHQIDLRMKEAVSQLDDALENFRKSSDLAVGPICSGGAHGVPSQLAGQISQLNAAVSSNLGAVRANMSAVRDKLIPGDLNP